MASIRDQILDYIVDQLNLVAGVDAVRSRLVPVRREEGIRVIVTPEEESPAEMVSLGVRRELTVKTSIIARGTIPDQMADAVAAKVYAKLKGTNAVAKMGGLADEPIVEAGRGFLFEDADTGAIDYQILWTVVYITDYASEETQP
jgi:hypothetical protein